MTELKGSGVSRDGSLLLTDGIDMGGMMMCCGGIWWWPLGDTTLPGWLLPRSGHHEQHEIVGAHFVARASKRGTATGRVDSAERTLGASGAASRVRARRICMAQSYA